MSAAETRTSYEHITVARDGAIGRLTLNRPTRRNALSLALMQEAIAGLRELSADPECRVIVIAGNGPAFSAGHDLSEMRGREPRLLRRAVHGLHAADADHPRRAAAGDRARARHRHRGRLPAGRDVRSRGRRRGGHVRHARRQDRAVLLDADGRRVARRRPQAGDGDAAHRHAHRRPHRRRLGARQPRRAGRRAGRRGRRAGGQGDRRRRPTRWRSARPRSGSRSTAPRPAPTSSRSR